ncbi:hypothetical protein N7540_000610 [Penicillium herquei]|nr:hypothetical protein N7540_000610 [Penicillium herquei]
MLALPPHIYAGRVIYAVILLTKLHKAFLAFGRELSEGISIEKLRLEAYIERLLLISTQLNAEDGRSSLSRAFLIMPQLKQWLGDNLSKSKIEKNEILAGKAVQAHCADSVFTSANQAKLTHNLPPLGADRQAFTSSNSSNPLDSIASQSGKFVAQEETTENGADTSSHELVSDSWFWEFFNVDMLH